MLKKIEPIIRSCLHCSHMNYYSIVDKYLCSHEETDGRLLLFGYGNLYFRDEELSTVFKEKYPTGFPLWCVLEATEYT